MLEPAALGLGFNRCSNSLISKSLRTLSNPQLLKSVRMWFVYGLYALYQYWLSCYYSLLVLMIYISQSIKSHHDTTCLAIYLWLSMMSYHLRLCYYGKMKPSPDDSG